jgi:hypothetical protein
MRLGKAMRANAIILIAITACLASPSAHAQATVEPASVWQEYRPAKSSFRVEMPGTPKAGAQDLKSSPGQKLYYATMPFGKGAFTVVYSEVARDRLTAPADKTLDEVLATAVKAMKAKVLTEQRETVGNFPARRLAYDPANGLIVTKRFVLAKNWIYQIAAVGPPGFSTTPEATRFLNSFAVIGL